MFQCPSCSETKGSRRALNRHIVWHRRNEDGSSAPGKSCFDVRRVVLHDNSASVDPAGPSDNRIANGSRDPRIASRMPQAVFDGQDGGWRYRKQIDSAVLRLKERHRRDRTTLARPTEELAQWLVTTDGEVPWLTCVGIVVAAKHFAGTQSPRRKVTGPTAKRPAPPVPHEPDAVRRPLFRDEPAESTSMGSAAIAPIDPPPSPSVRGRSRQSLDDEGWRIDIWRSYGSKEISPPSPIGCQLSPSWALGNSSPPSAERPLELWSPSSNDEPWGPDSPDEALEDDAHPDTVPGWPVFMDALGEPLARDGSQRRAHVRQWCKERTAGVPRTAPKRRHHLRSRRRSRERYAAISAGAPAVQLVWSANGGQYRQLSASDVQLPSPPSDQSSLARTRRLMLLSRRLPMGCRLRPRGPSSRHTTERPAPLRKRRREPSPDIVIAAPTDDTL